jgi:hypothetical protein
MNMNNRTVVAVDKRWQDSTSAVRRVIGFGPHEPAKPRPPTGSTSSLVKIAGVACLAGLALVSLPSPSWAQEHEKEKPKQSETNSREVDRDGNREGERGQDTGRGVRNEEHRFRNRSDGRRLETREFRDHFGQRHRFRPGWIGGGYNEFGYGGFTFGFLEPWPIGWSYNDDVYVMDVDGGYVLCNPLYPGITVGVIIE